MIVTLFLWSIIRSPAFPQAKDFKASHDREKTAGTCPSAETIAAACPPVLPG
jgi:hypothetical protein